MKIALINGSPKTVGSSSGILLENLKSSLLENLKNCLLENEKTGLVENGKLKAEEVEVTEAALHTADVSKAVLEELTGADVWVFACPLYVDGIPGHLLSCMTQMENASFYNRKILVYGMVNCGFFEGIQAETALEILENWCIKAGLSWGGGIGVGGGGALSMVPKTPSGHGPMAPIDRAVSGLAEKIIRREVQENNYVSVAMPRILYQMAAQMGWRQMIRLNGGKAKDLGKRWG